jgi:hypothetical protein
MGDLEPTDRNVVPLRRGNGPDEKERKRLASTIFAEPDEISTFSQGNLVPPRPQSPDQEARRSDPFFDDRLPHPVEPLATAGSAETGTVADDYFAQLSQQSASEMTNGLSERDQPPAARLPGSAQLPAALARVRHRAWPSRLERLARPAPGRLAAISSSTVLLGVGVVLALVLGGGTTPTGVPTANPPSQLASVLDFGRSPLSLPGDQSSRTASPSTGPGRASQHRTSGSHGHGTAGVSNKRRRVRSNGTKSKSTAHERTSRQGTSGQTATTAPEPTSRQSVSTSPSYDGAGGGGGTTSGSPTAASASDSAGSASLPAGPTGIGDD